MFVGGLSQQGSLNSYVPQNVTPAIERMLEVRHGSKASSPVVLLQTVNGSLTVAGFAIVSQLISPGTYTQVNSTDRQEA